MRPARATAARPPPTPPWRGDGVYDDGGRAAAGFKGEARDCVTQAIAIATGAPYRAVYDAIDALAAEGRPRRSGRRFGARTGVSLRDRHAYLTALGWRWTPTMR